MRVGGMRAGGVAGHGGDADFFWAGGGDVGLA